MVQGGCGYNITSGKEHMYVARPSYEKEMVNKSMAVGCFNTPSDCESLFKLPSNSVLRCKWEKQVQRTQAQWKVPTTCIFVVTVLLRTVLRSIQHLLLSLESRRGVWLKPGALPTIFHRPSTSQGHTSEAEERPSQKRAAGTFPMVGDEVLSE